MTGVIENRTLRVCSVLMCSCLLFFVNMYIVLGVYFVLHLFYAVFVDLNANELC